MISVIIPAYNEEGFIGETLRLLLQSDDPTPAPPAGSPPVEVIVVANGCRDGTVAEAKDLTEDFAKRGWALQVLSLPQGSKTLALNAGSASARYPAQIFVDADIHVSPGLIAALARVLDRPEPCYASGRPRIRRAQSWISRQYARFWQRLPFMAKGVPGCGVYAVNAAGRARWDQIPDVTADDIFVRSHFSPEERADCRGVGAAGAGAPTAGSGVARADRTTPPPARHRRADRTDRGGKAETADPRSAGLCRLCRGGAAGLYPAFRQPPPLGAGTRRRRLSRRRQAQVVPQLVLLSSPSGVPTTTKCS